MAGNADKEDNCNKIVAQLAFSDEGNIQLVGDPEITEPLDMPHIASSDTQAFAQTTSKTTQLK